MRNTNFVFKNSTKKEFIPNILLVFISMLLAFIAFKLVTDKVSIIIYALSIACSYCKIAVESIEKLAGKKFNADIILTLAILILFSSQNFFASAVVSIIYSFGKCISNLIYSSFSDKLIESQNAELKYSVIKNGVAVLKPAYELEAGDIVLAKRNEYLSFDYNIGENKDRKRAGIFKASDEAEVTVVSNVPYEIDFFETESKQPKTEFRKVIKTIINIYTVAMVVFSIIMFIVSITSGKDATIMKSLYTLGVYLMFAYSVPCFSGFLFSGLAICSSLKTKEIYLKDISELESFANVKKIYFNSDVILSDNSITPDAQKAIRIAEILKIEVELLSKENKETTKKLADLLKIKNYISDGDEDKIYNILEKETKENQAAYISKNSKSDFDNVICLNEGNVNLQNHGLSAVVKSIKDTKIYKRFVWARVAIGVFINSCVVFAFASDKFGRILSNLLIKVNSSAVLNENGESTVSIKELIVQSFMYRGSLAPWIIAVVHLILINVFLLISVSFLNNNKKLR